MGALTGGSVAGRLKLHASPSASMGATTGDAASGRYEGPSQAEADRFVYRGRAAGRPAAGGYIPLLEKSYGDSGGSDPRSRF